MSEIIRNESKYVVIWDDDYYDTFYDNIKSAEQDIEDTEINIGISGRILTIEDYLSEEV